jgi:hypothetical protein
MSVVKLRKRYNTYFNVTVILRFVKVPCMQTTAVECEQINFNRRYVHEFSSVGQRESMGGIVKWMKGIRHTVAETGLEGGQMKHTQ